MVRMMKWAVNLSLTMALGVIDLAIGWSEFILTDLESVAYKHKQKQSLTHLRRSVRWILHILEEQRNE